MSELLEKPYLSAKDLKILIPEASLETCRKIIEECQLEMKEKKYMIPPTKTKLALTKIIRKQLGI